MADRNLIILGASVRAAAQSAVRSGYRPYGIDLFADADLQALGPTRKIARYPAEFLTALAETPEAPWMYTGGLENYPRLIARLTQLRPLIGNGPEVLSRVRDPQWLANLLHGEVIRYPRIARTLTELSSGSANWLRKPRRSGGGLRIGRFIREGEAPAEPRLRSERRFYFQEEIAGESLSAALVAIGGRVHWIGAARQWIGREWGAPGDFHYAGSCAPAEVTIDEQDQIVRIAQRMADECRMTGLFGFDLVRHEQGLFLIEVNPRYTASMELFERLTERCLIGEHCGEIPVESTSPPIPHRYQAKLVVYSTERGVAGKKLQQALAQLNEEGIRSADIPVIGSEIAQDSPICTLLTGGDNEREIGVRLHTAAVAVGLACRV